MNLPTQLTVLRIILTPVFFSLIFFDAFYIKFTAFIIYIIASLTDWYDGYFAKKYGTVTKWGKFLDPLADKILVSSAFIAFYILGYVKLWIVIVIIFRDFLITALRSYALFKKQPVVTSDLARAKTFIQMASVYVIFMVLIFEHLGIEKGKEFGFIVFLNQIHFLDRLMLFVALLTVYTAIKYFVENKSHIVSFLKACYRVFIPSDL